ncbi:preprotein translocase subunit YajC [Treponema sp.]|uniref:preprotein translocase subunit YajC n=1 Tax=Treponema sp. TaxID=166 RepID=UPI00298E4C6A|nr:preprotein translocase subunit YajC [Treponema sp.]MCR5612363.1 preprotein translocase subunit YajC [Treponema sp.]
MSLLTLLDGLAANGNGQMGGQMGSLAITVVAMIAIFYFFLLRPQKKQENETKKMLEALKKGDKIVTIGGIHGTVFSVKDSTVVVKVDGETKIEFTKTAIAKVVNEAEEKAVAEAKAEKKSKSKKEE